MKLFFGALLFVCGCLFPAYWAFVPGFRTAVRSSLADGCILLIVIGLVIADTLILRRKASSK